MVRRSAVVALAFLCACMPPDSPASGGSEGSDPDDTADTEASAGEGETGSDTNAYEDPPCGDALEPNDAAEAATALSLAPVEVTDEGVYDARVTVDARLCEAEHDWYRVGIAALEFKPQVVRIDAILEGASWCGQHDGCDDPTLVSGPDHTIAIEIYDAASMVMLTAAVATDGRLDVDGWGDDYGKDLLLHVYSPVSAATFGYALHVDVRNDDSDVDCDC